MSNSILNEIAEYKRGWVTDCKAKVSEQQLLAAAAGYTPTSFLDALKSRIEKRENAVIAEVKKASPSKGIIREDFDPVWIARHYEEAGAACLSVLTDVKYFQGSDDYVREIRKNVSIPILRKEFLVDPYQVIEARALGADAILIIMAMVDDALAIELRDAAHEQGLTVLPEVHNFTELDRALALETPLVGINNRDLHTFETSLETTFSMLSEIPNDRLVITESGIFTNKDVVQMNINDVFGFLVGESLMRQPDPGAALKSLLTYENE